MNAEFRLGVTVCPFSDITNFYEGLVSLVRLVLTRRISFTYRQRARREKSVWVAWPCRGSCYWWREGEMFSYVSPALTKTHWKRRSLVAIGSKVGGCVGGSEQQQSPSHTLV